VNNVTVDNLLEDILRTIKAPRVIAKESYANV
jgi:hypothetical protein